MLFVVLLLGGSYVSVGCQTASAQDDVAALKKRIAELEKENQHLRGLQGVQGYLRQVENGVERKIDLGEGRAVKLVIAREGWNCPADDVGAVCVSCVETIVKVIPPAAGRELTVFVIRDRQGPIALTQRGPRGEYIVLLNTGDLLWAQLAYQFAHEFGHVLCGDLSLKLPQHWFEEAFCESMSLWTMDQMGESWKTKAPYQNWQGYAANLSNYVAEVRNRVSAPDDLAQWYREQQPLLTRNAYDRDLNLVLAKYLAAEAHDHPAFYEAFYYLRRHDAESPQNSMEWLLQDWQATCPEKLKFAPRKLAEKLGVKLDE